MTESMPLVPQALRAGEPFFQSQKRKWVEDSVSAPPAGSWQLAPAGIANPFDGGGLFGEAVYSPQDRNLISTSAPVVSGLVCVAKDKASTQLQAGDIVVVTNTSYNRQTHTVQKATLRNIQGAHVAVVAAYHRLSTGSSYGTQGTSVSLICCGQIKLNVSDVAALIPGFYGKSGKLPGDTFKIGNKNFIVLTPVSKTTHTMRCMMDAF